VELKKLPWKRIAGALAVLVVGGLFLWTFIKSLLVFGAVIVVAGLGVVAWRKLRSGAAE